METMIASFVITVGLVGAVALFGPAIRFSDASSDYIIASTLAQEGVELVRNIRDNNMLTGTFDTGISTDGTYCIDYADSAVASCGDGALYQSSGWYVHNVTSEKSLFRRNIYIDHSADKIDVYSYVVWRDGSFPSTLVDPSSCTRANKCVFAQATLTNWK